MNQNKEIKDYVELSNTKRVIAFLSIAVIYFFYCYNFSITAIYKPLLIDSYGFSASDLSDAFALMSFGTLFGTIIAGFLASKINKKIALIVMALGFTIPTLLHIVTFDSYYSWVVLRFIAGTSLGGIFGTAVAIICDMFPAKHRGKLTSLASSLFALAFSFGFFVSSKFEATNQYMVLIIGAVMPLIGIVLTILFVPNTDKLLQQENKLSKESENVAKPSYFQFVKSAPIIVLLAVILSGMNFTGYSGFTNNSSLFISSQVVEDSETLVERGILKESNGVYTYNEKTITVTETVDGESIDTTYVAGDVLSENDIENIAKSDARSKASAAMSFVGNGHFVGFLVFGFIGDFFGRKKNILGMLISAIAGAAILLVSYNGSMIIYTLLGIVMGFGFGFSGVWGAYYSELFDPKYRGMAAGFCFNMGRIISMFSVPFVGRMVDSLGVSKALWIPLAAFIVGAIVWSMLPETLKPKKV